MSWLKPLLPLMLPPLLGTADCLAHVWWPWLADCFSPVFNVLMTLLKRHDAPPVFAMPLYFIAYHQISYPTAVTYTFPAVVVMMRSAASSPEAQGYFSGKVSTTPELAANSAL